METGNFPLNHDNPNEWPYWSPTHRAIIEQMKQHAQPEEYTKYPGYSLDEIKMIESLVKHGMPDLEQTLETIDEELDALHQALTEVERYKRIATRAMEEIEQSAPEE